MLTEKEAKMIFLNNKKLRANLINSRCQMISHLNLYMKNNSFININIDCKFKNIIKMEFINKEVLVSHHIYFFSLRTAQIKGKQ